MIRTKLLIRPSQYDSDDIVFLDDEDGILGFGFRPKAESGHEARIKVLHCPVCGAENYAAAVESGACVWCNYDPNEKEEGKD